MVVGNICLLEFPFLETGKQILSQDLSIRSGHSYQILLRVIEEEIAIVQNLGVVGSGWEAGILITGSAVGVQDQNAFAPGP